MEETELIGWALESLRTNRISRLTLTSGLKHAELLSTELSVCKSIRVLDMDQSIGSHPSQPSMDGEKLIRASLALSVALQLNSSLRRVVLKSCRIDDTCVQVLALGIFRSSNIREVDLSFNQMGPIGMDAVKNLIMKNHLEHVDITGTLSATVERAACLSMLSAAVASTSSLKSLDISFNEFPSVSNALEFGRAVEANQSLTQLGAMFCSIGEPISI